MDKIEGILLEAVKEALTGPAEQRLFRSGKLAGLFSSRHGAAGAAAERAVREGLLEVVRTESRGKSSQDWVRATPRAVEFVHGQESPVAVLHELRAALQANQEGIPRWLKDMHERMAALAGQLTTEVRQLAHRLEALSQRAEEALRRLEAVQPRVAEGVARDIPWAQDALAYLERRCERGLECPCPLSELFLAIRDHHAELTMTGFHAGLRRLFDRGLLRLVPYEGANGLPEPEYALLDGHVTYYYATT